jgi:hypothetical protein
MTPFAQALYTICVEEQSTTSIEDLRNAALAKMASGEVKSLVSSSLNGKSFSFQISKPADELFIAATQAIRAYNNGIITATQLDFTNI